MLAHITVAVRALGLLFINNIFILVDFTFAFPSWATPAHPSLTPSFTTFNLLPFIPIFITTIVILIISFGVWTHTSG
jgi:hypothetical protein